MIPVSILLKLADWGVPESLRKPIAYVGGALLVLALLWGLKAAYDASVVADHEADIAADTINARDDAADERASDAILNAGNEKDLNDAISAAPIGGNLPPAQFAADCERLRKLGRIPAACRNQGSNRTEASAGR